MLVFSFCRVSTKNDIRLSMKVTIEPTLNERRHELVICFAPMYTYTDWQIMLLGIENWLALGATKIVVPVQSTSSNTLFILKEYEKAGILICLFVVFFLFFFNVKIDYF